MFLPADLQRIKRLEQMDDPRQIPPETQTAGTNIIRRPFSTTETFFALFFDIIFMTILPLFVKGQRCSWGESFAQFSYERNVQLFRHFKVHFSWKDDLSTFCTKFFLKKVLFFAQVFQRYLFAVFYKYNLQLLRIFKVYFSLKDI